MMMNLDRMRPACAAMLLSTTCLASTVVAAHDAQRPILIVTSTNDPAGNSVAVFRLQTTGAASLALSQTLPTGGTGGAAGNGGIVQFDDQGGAVANYGSGTVTRLARSHDAIRIDGTIALAAGCANPASVSLAHGHLYVAGANCAESHRWPDGTPDGATVTLPDTSAGQIAAGNSWAAVTLKSGSVVHLAMDGWGRLTGQSSPVTLPAVANNTPLGAAFWGDTLGFNPAHSVDSFALVSRSGSVFPVAGPTPAFPSNAPCWIAKGNGNIWYAGNTPGEAISIFFSDSQGGVFYKSVPIGGNPTDLTVSADGHWLAAIYSSQGSAYVAVYSIDSHGDLTPVATSEAIGVASFSGVAISD